MPPLGADGEATEPDAEDPGAADETLDEALLDAQQAYDDAQAALREGDFTGYGEAIDRLGEALERAAAITGTAIEPPLTEPLPEDGELPPDESAPESETEPVAFRP